MSVLSVGIISYCLQVFCIDQMPSLVHLVTPRCQSKKSTKVKAGIESTKLMILRDSPEADGNLSNALLGSGTCDQRDPLRRTHA